MKRSICLVFFCLHSFFGWGAVSLDGDFDISTIFGIRFFISFEEGFSDGSIFRPAGYNFPPSYPRSGFKFEANGRYTFFEPASNDAGHVQVPGRWHQVSDDVYEIYKNGRLEGVYRLQGGAGKINRWLLREL